MRYKAILRWILWSVRIFRAVLTVYGVALFILLIPPLMSGGLEGVWGKLMHIAGIGMAFNAMGPDRIASQVQRMWQAQFLLLAMTWAASSIQRRLSNRLCQSTSLR